MFVAYEVSPHLICELRPVVETLKRHDRDAANQLVRAGTSVLLNLGKGARRQGGDQRRFYAMSHGSANELRAVSMSPTRGAGRPMPRSPARLSTAYSCSGA